MDDGVADPVGILKDGRGHEHIHLEFHDAVPGNFQGVPVAAVAAAGLDHKGLRVVGGNNVGVVAGPVVLPAVLTGDVAEGEEGFLEIGEIIDLANHESDDGGGAAGLAGVEPHPGAIVVVIQFASVRSDRHGTHVRNFAGGPVDGQRVVQVKHFRGVLEAAGAAVHEFDGEEVRGAAVDVSRRDDLGAASPLDPFDLQVVDTQVAFVSLAFVVPDGVTPGFEDIAGGVLQGEFGEVRDHPVPAEG